MTIKFSLLLLFNIFAICVFSQDAIRINAFNLDEGIAIQGYDPVAYFTEGRAVKGKKELGAVAYGAVKYYFSSKANKDAFIKSPVSYEPQYGGWCAYAMGSDGSKVDINPETFKIIGGKLFLFYNRLFNNTLKTWNKNEAVLRKNADANWQKIFH